MDGEGCDQIRGYNRLMSCTGKLTQALKLMLAVLQQVRSDLKHTVESMEQTAGLSFSKFLCLVYIPAEFWFLRAEVCIQQCL